MIIFYHFLPFLTMTMTMTMTMTLTKAYLKHGQGSLHAEDSGLRAGLEQEQLLVVTAEGSCSLAPEGVFIIRAAKCGGVADPYPDPDPYWIRIQSGQWIRIGIRIWNPDPDPGGQK